MSQIRDYILTYFAKDNINLGNVDNTSDLNKPISLATKEELDNKLNKTDLYVKYINNLSGNVILTKKDINLNNVDNTSDIDKPISMAVQIQLDNKVPLSAYNIFSINTTNQLNNKINSNLLGKAGGVVPLNNNKEIDTIYIPTLNKDKINSALTADSFSIPVTLNLKGDVNGVVTLSGKDEKVFMDTSLQINTSLVEGVYGSTLESPKITVDNKGRILDIKSVPINKSSVSNTGLVKLNDSVTSTSITEAATARVVKQVYDFVYNVSTTYIKNSSKGIPNGVASLDATGTIPKNQLPTLTNVYAEKLYKPSIISCTGDADWSVSFDGSSDVSSFLKLKDSLINSAGTYGNEHTTLKLTFDKQGRTLAVESVPIEIPFSNLNKLPNKVNEHGISDVYTKEEVNTLLNSFLNIIPVGTIITAYRNDEISGWLKMTGEFYDRKDYPRLSEVCDMHPHPKDTEFQFYLEDIGGLFPRYMDSKGNIDSSRSLGSIQMDTIKAHSHKVSEGSNSSQMNGNDEILTSGSSFTKVKSYQSTTSITGGTETRPKNIALLACIKY